MNRSLANLCATLLLSVAILPTAVSAQTTEAAPTSFNPYVPTQASVNPVSPFNLTYLAYQGYLIEQGIPSNSALVDAIAAGTVTAQDLMQAAVKANQISEQTLTDRDYRSALTDQLQGLGKD
ncbi:MAG: hypothetical protein KME16_09065 [Scytolyngbya sp. HA4215-MV1]|jgi:hypothetical protein|nr:hypothetical protein [Scytolyngbya sp. HA4215-MV1]